MRVVLVHHADAVEPHVDPQRPLSARGHEQAAEAAAGIKRAGLVPVEIWHSGKLRARQTGEAVLRVCAPFAVFKMVRGLQPDDPPDWMRDELAAAERDIALVGHMPHLARLARMLDPSAELALHGWLAFEKQSDGKWRALAL
jgi:phosphohistidine phosphatase